MPSYEFSVSEFTTMPWTFEQDVERYASLGVSAMEVCEVKLDDKRIDDQLAHLAQCGIAISSVQPVVRTLFPSATQPHPQDIPARMERFRRTIAAFGDHAHGVPFVTNTGNPPGGNMAAVLSTAAQEYRALADDASEHGATIALEPLNPSIQNVETSIWLIEQAMTIVEAVDRPNFGLCIDYWNIFQNPYVEDAIRAAGGRIFIVQVSDWQTPRSYADRRIVGEGTIPFRELLRATYDSGYRGYYELEIFSGDVPDSLWTGDMEHVIVESRRNLDTFWSQAFDTQ